MSAPRRVENEDILFRTVGTAIRAPGAQHATTLGEFLWRTRDLPDLRVRRAIVRVIGELQRCRTAAGTSYSDFYSAVLRQLREQRATMPPLMRQAAGAAGDRVRVPPYPRNRVNHPTLPSAESREALLPYRQLALRVISQAFKDCSATAAAYNDRTGAREFLAGSAMLYLWCEVAALDARSTIARAKELLRETPGRKARVSDNHVSD